MTRITLTGGAQGLKKALEIVRRIGNVHYRYTETPGNARLDIEGSDAIIKRVTALVESAYGGLPLAWQYVRESRG